MHEEDPLIWEAKERYNGGTRKVRMWYERHKGTRDYSITREGQRFQEWHNKWTKEVEGTNEGGKKLIEVS